MGKTPKIKNSKKLSLHSRAARRNNPSPPRSSFPTQNSDATTSDFLGPQLSGAITKKKVRKPLKRKQRLRLEAGKEKALNVKGRTETKVQESVMRGDRKRKRRKKWEEIQEGISKEIEKKDKKDHPSSAGTEGDLRPTSANTSSSPEVDEMTG